MAHRPNILFLMSDQHRADVAGYAGNSVVRTPVLDELARNSVVFQNAYAASPICVPGRQCMMSGQLPKTCGCEGWTDLAPDYTTFAREFSRYAYQTVCSGKLHHMGKDQMQGWTQRVAPDAVVSDQHIAGKIQSEFDRYTAAPGTGKWSNQKEVERAGIAHGPYQTFDATALDAAANFVRQYFAHAYHDKPGSHRPLMLKMSLLQPHYPFFTDESKFHYYLNRVPIYNESPCDHPVLSQSQLWQPVNVSERDIRRATAAYYGMIETVDAHFGKLMETLEHVGQNLDDWIIIYTSDHGEMLGQHGLWEKARFYEASVRVPLLIRWPRRFTHSKLVNKNVSLCDLFATLCDLADIPAPAGLDSRSMVPLMTDPASDWHNEVVSQVGTNHAMIKWDHLKYQYYGGSACNEREQEREVLFDLHDDPGENTNVAQLPKHAATIKRFRKRLATLGHGPDADPDYKNAGYHTGNPAIPLM